MTAPTRFGSTYDTPARPKVYLILTGEGAPPPHAPTVFTSCDHKVVGGGCLRLVGVVYCFYHADAPSHEKSVMMKISPGLIFRGESDGALHFLIWWTVQKVAEIYYHHGLVGADHFLGQLLWDHGMSIPAAESEKNGLPPPKKLFEASLPPLGRCCETISTPTRHKTLLGHGSGCNLPPTPLRSRLHPQQTSFWGPFIFWLGPSHVGVTVWVPK